jgi:hypothetical protein
MTIIKLTESGNLNCVFTTTREPDGTWKHVSKCGVTRRSPPEYPTFHRRCETGGCLPDPPAELLAEDAKPKSITAKAWSFHWAQVRWIKAGPVRYFSPRPATQTEAPARRAVVR